MAGFAFAFGLAFLSYVRVDLSGGMPKLSYREQQSWESETTLFVNAPTSPIGSVQTKGTDDGRLRQLTALYLEYASSDDVYRLMRSGGPIRGKLQALPVYVNGSSEFGSLPMITLAAVAPDPVQARRLAARYSETFRQFLVRLQRGEKTPEKYRVQLTVVREPRRALLVEPRKRTRPIVIFMTAMIAVLGLAFVLENTRPRVRKLEGEARGSEEAPAVVAEGKTASRRTA